MLFLPPYSPDLNPIEQVFAKLKAILRKKALRTIQALWNELGCIHNAVSAEECRRFIQHAGYFSQRENALERFQPNWKHSCCIGGYCVRPRQALASFPVRLNMV